MPRYYYVIQCTQRGEEEEHTTHSGHRDYDLAVDACEILQEDFNKQYYINYYVSQYHNGIE